MTDFPIMKGEARMAVGADPYFEAPLFSHVIDNLWQGCSPAEFPDELETYDYDVKKVSYPYPQEIKDLLNSPEPVHCKWLYADKKDPTEIDEPRFDKILNLFQWSDYAVPNGTEKVTVEMYDGHGVPDEQQVDSLANKVITWLDEGNKVLVHCQAGLNRSSLIVARVLMKNYEMTADEAIQHIRDNRSPLCLCNDNFRQWLKGLR